MPNHFRDFTAIDIETTDKDISKAELVEIGAVKVRDGVIVDSYRQMAAALEQTDAIEPLDCRRYAEERFAPERMVGDYLRAYREALAT